MKYSAFIALACVACSKDPKADAAPVASSSAAIAIAASAASATATATARETANGSQLDGLNCRAHAGSTTVNLHFRFTLMKGTLLVDGPETRRILTKATPSGGTYVMQFVSYESGDTKPDAEKLTQASIVSVGDHDEVFFDGEVHPAGTSPTASLRCE